MAVSYMQECTTLISNLFSYFRMGVDLCLEEMGILGHRVPICPHGPMFLFEEFFNGGSQKFFACSACRGLFVYLILLF